MKERNLPELMKYSRQEWLQKLSENVYGDMPEYNGVTTWRLIEEVPNAAGKAITRTVEITFPTPDGESFTFPIDVTTPCTASKDTPKGAFVYISFGKAKYYPVEELVEMDVIVAEMVMNDVSPDRNDEFLELMATHYYQDGQRTTDGWLMRSLNISKLAFIITDKGQEIAELLISTSPRGVTLVDVTGVYSNTSKKMMICALKESELPEFQRKILEKDEHAFIIYSESQQIVGNGFYIYG